MEENNNKGTEKEFAQRFNEGKPRWSLIHFASLTPMLEYFLHDEVEGVVSGFVVNSKERLLDLACMLCDNTFSVRREILAKMFAILYKIGEKETDNNRPVEWIEVDFDVLKPLLEVLEFGASKYKANGWKKGFKGTEVYDSLMRHVISYCKLDRNRDEESGLLEVGHIWANLMFISYHDVMCFSDNKRDSKLDLAA